MSVTDYYRSIRISLNCRNLGKMKVEFQLHDDDWGTCPTVLFKPDYPDWSDFLGLYNPDTVYNSNNTQILVGSAYPQSSKQLHSGRWSTFFNNNNIRSLLHYVKNQPGHPRLVAASVSTFNGLFITLVCLKWRELFNRVM